MKPDNRQYAAIHIALNKLGWDKRVKEELVISYTKDDSKKSCSDLNFDQAANLIRFLNAEIGKQKDNDERACNSIRRKIIAIAHQMGWQKYDGAVMVLKDGKPVADYDRINAYLVTHTAAKKMLKEMGKAELQKAAHQFEQMYKNYNQPRT